MNNPPFTSTTGQPQPGGQPDTKQVEQVIQVTEARLALLDERAKTLLDMADQLPTPEQESLSPLWNDLPPVALVRVLLLNYAREAEMETGALKAHLGQARQVLAALQSPLYLLRRGPGGSV